MDSPDLLNQERARRGTRIGARALSGSQQAILILRWFLGATRVRQLASDNSIGESTAYAYLNEGITVPDGWPIWTSEVRPGREHDNTAVRNISLDPWRVGRIAAAALAILHFDHARTT